MRGYIKMWWLIWKYFKSKQEIKVQIQWVGFMNIKAAVWSYSQRWSTIILKWNQFVETGSSFLMYIWIWGKCWKYFKFQRAYILKFHIRTSWYYMSDTLGWSRLLSVRCKMYLWKQVVSLKYRNLYVSIWHFRGL